MTISKTWRLSSLIGAVLVFGACSGGEVAEQTSTSIAQSSSTTPSQPDRTTIITIAGEGGLVDGPVLVSPPPESDELVGMAAEIKGLLVFDEQSGCLLLELERVRYPLVWPAGTSWQADPPAVRLDDDQLVEPGMTVYGGGGYLDRNGIEMMAGPHVAEAAAACVGPTGEIAIFNIGSEVNVTG